MEPLDEALDAFFCATDVPDEDEAFAWRVIEEYERRTRGVALAWKAAQTAGAAMVGALVVAALGSLEPDSQVAVTEAIRALVLVGTLGVALTYAGKSLFGNTPALALR